MCYNIRRERGNKEKIMKIIAETAFNHNGSVEYLLELITKSSQAGADFVTTQIMDVKHFCVQDYERYQIYIENEISKEDWIRIFNYCKNNDINLIPCPLELSSFRLCYDYGFRLFKIHATDISNKLLLEDLHRKKCKIILETQCATNVDIRFALNILRESIICIMHGFSNYPTEVEDLNLNALDFLREEYKVDVGFADHSLDTLGIPVMALSKNIEYLEKHVTLSRNNRNFDWQVSLYPEQFASMVNNINYYEKALGKKVKHPSKTEMNFRNILYKKYIKGEFKRSDSGLDYISDKFHNLDKNKIGISIIARGNSKRLPRKIFKEFHHKSVIQDLYTRISQTNLPTFITTSYENSDDELEKICIQNRINCFRGHPESVLDRMLSLALKEEFGGIIRVTGDNPLTDPAITNKMVSLYRENNLDYVRCNGLPFGITAEVFSVKYLWELYKKIDNPLDTEYLSWFVIKDDECKKGCLNFDIEEEMKYINLSIDVQEDYDRCLQLLKSVNKPFEKITLHDIITNVNLGNINLDKQVKLPTEILSLKTYMNIIENLNYKIVVNVNMESEGYSPQEGKYYEKL